MAEYETCEECGSLIIRDEEGVEYCKLCGWVRTDPTSSKKIPSYVG